MSTSPSFFDPRTFLFLWKEFWGRNKMYMVAHDQGHDLPLDPIFSDSVPVYEHIQTCLSKFDWNLPSKK